MISFRRIESKVEIRIECGVLETYYSFEHNCSGNVHAELMREAYQKHLINL